MGIRLAGGGEVREVVERVVYAPGLQNSGDLELATKTITATAKQATPDYTTNLTLPAPADGRLQILRACLRAQVTIDSFGGTPYMLYYSIEVNGVERATGTFPSTGVNYKALDLTSGQFNLGTATEVKIYLWVDPGTVNAVVSLCQFWLAVGTRENSAYNWVWVLAHQGFVGVSLTQNRVGTGSPLSGLKYKYAYDQNDPSWRYAIASASGDGGAIRIPSLLSADGVAWMLSSGVTTDLTYLNDLYLVLRKEE